MVYISLYIALMASGLAFHGAEQRLFVYKLWLIFLFGFSAFRYRVGCDWISYEYMFSAAGPAGDNSFGIEPGFWTLLKIMHYFNLDYPYINLFVSGVFFVGLHSFAWRQPDPLAVLILAFPILILNMPMSALRQAVAIGILCFAFNSFVERRVVSFVFLVGVALLFHKSAAIFFLFAPFVRGQYSTQRLVLSSILAAPIGFIVTAGIGFQNYESRYISNVLVDAAGAPFRTGLIALAGLAFLLLLERNWLSRFGYDYKFVKISSYLMIAVFPLSFLSSVIADRFGYYMNIAELMTLSRIPFLVNINSRVLSAVPYAIGALSLGTWVFFSSLFARCYVPYETWYGN